MYEKKNFDKKKVYLNEDTSNQISFPFLLAFISAIIEPIRKFSGE